MQRSKPRLPAFAEVTTCSMPLRCPACGEGTTAVYMLRVHTNVEADVAAGNYTCGQCPAGAVLERVKPASMISVAGAEEITLYAK